MFKIERKAGNRQRGILRFGVDGEVCRHGGPRGSKGADRYSDNR
jgi:hypothetical protein